MSITVQAFLLCDAVAFPEPSRKTHIQGIFETITVTNFPANHANSAVYARLFVREVPMCAISIIMVLPSLAKTQLMEPRDMKPDVLGKISLNCRLTRVVLPQEGTYTLLLMVNGKTRSEFDFTAVKRPSVTIN